MQRVSQLLTRHALLVIVAVGAAVRFATLATQGFWLDEYVTVDVVQRAPADLLSAVQSGESNPALYYLLAGAWERIFGHSEFGIRSLSALIGTAAIPVVYMAAKTLISRRAGLIAAAITAASPLLIWYSQEARNYELLVFMAALGFLCFVKAVDEESGHRWLWAWVLASALTLTTHYFGGFLIAAEAIWLVARRPGPRNDTALSLGAIVAVGIALLPLMASQRGRGSWIDEYDLSGRLLQVPEHFLVGLQVPWAALPILAIAVIGLVGLYAATQAREPERRGIIVAGGITMAGFALVLLAALFGGDYILSRNLLELWPPFAVTLSALLASIPVRALGTSVTVGLCALGLGLAIWTAVTPAAQRPKYPELAERLEGTASPRLIVSQSSFSAPLVLYLDGSRVAVDDDLRASELVVVTPRSVEDYAVGVCWWIATCGGVDVEPPPPFEPPSGFELEETGSTEFFDYQVFRASRMLPIPRPLEYFTPRVFGQDPP